MTAWLKALIYALFLVVVSALNVVAWKRTKSIEKDPNKKVNENLLIWLSAFGGAFGSLIARILYKTEIKHGNVIVDITTAIIEVAAVVLICILA